MPAQARLVALYVLVTLLACLAAWALWRRYRETLARLTLVPLGRGAARADALTTAVGVAQATAELPTWLAPTVPTLQSWRREEWRLISLFAGLSLLMAGTHAVLVQALALEVPWSGSRWALLTAVFAWPVLAAVAELQRWSRPQLSGALLGWFASAFVLAVMQPAEAQPARAVLLGLAIEIGPPALALMLLLTLPSTRAAGPWLWPPLALIAFTALFVFEGMARLSERWWDGRLAWLAGFDPSWFLVPLALCTAALAWWPLSRFARWLADAYARRRVSDLVIVFGAAWMLSLGWDALARGPIVLLPLLWLPLVMAVLEHRAPKRAPAAPTLLVLRVFRQDAEVSALFDDVIARWRTVGNTVLVAGTELSEQSVDAADLFDYFDGQLVARFVQQAPEVPQRLAAFEWRPDTEGRFRVNECYCHDHGWQVALAALVQRADLVLTDLRGFQPNDAGCRFELAVLARASHVTRVVVLTDDHTDVAVARADAARAPPRRFVWIDLGTSSPSRRQLARRVREALAGALSGRR
jgi:hypothetical protein